MLYSATLLPHMNVRTNRQTSAESAFAPFGQAPFRVFWLGTLCFQLGMNMSMVASGWLVYQLTGSAIALGGIWTVSGVSLVLLPMIGGVIADRFPKARIIALSQSVILLNTTIILALLATQQLAYWHLIVNGLLAGAAFAVNLPARQALIPDLVPAVQLANGVALSAAAFNMTRVLGPAAAGILVSWIGLQGLYAVMIGFYLVGVLTILSLPGAGGRQPAVGRGLQEFVLGFQYLRKSAVLRSLIWMAMAYATFGTFYQLLMPVFARDVLDVGASGLGLLLGATGAGAVVGSGMVAWLGAKRRSAGLLLATGIVYGVVLIGFAFSGGVGWALFFLFLVGAAGGVFGALNNTLLMSRAEQGMRGRVMGFYFTATGLLPLLAVLVGAIAASVGGPLTVGGGGLIMLILMVGLGVRHPELRKFARNAPPEGTRLAGPVAPLAGSPWEAE